jgi:hypothetical protein
MDPIGRRIKIAEVERKKGGADGGSAAFSGLPQTLVQS